MELPQFAPNPNVPIHRGNAYITNVKQGQYAKITDFRVSTVNDMFIIGEYIPNWSQKSINAHSYAFTPKYSPLNTDKLKRKWDLDATPT